VKPNLKHDEREGNANHRDNRIHRHGLPKGIAQEGRERGDDIGGIESAALNECEYN